MKKAGIWVLLTMMILSVMGCGQAKAATPITENAVILSKDGSITGVYVDVFDREYYTTEGLEAMAREEADAFNQSVGAEKVSFDKIELDEDSVVKLYLKYTDSSAYADFNDTVFFAGTVAEAYSAGIDLDTKLTSLGKEEKTIGKDDLLQMGSSKLVVLKESAFVRLPGNATYVSDGASVTSVKNEIKANFDQDLIYIIYK